jgi:hypothetical protein
MSMLVADTTKLSTEITGVAGVQGVSAYETALVGLGLGLVNPILSMANPCFGTIATFAYAMFNAQRTSGNLARQVNMAIERLYDKIIEDTTAYTNSKIQLTMFNAAQNANREAIAAVMDEMLWVPEMLDQAAGQEDAEHKQTRVMYQLVLQHDLAKLSANIFGDCIYDADSSECKAWQEKGTFIQAIVFATVHLQVLNDIAISDTRYMSAIRSRLKTVSTKYHNLLEQSLAGMDRKIQCLIGQGSDCQQGVPRGQSVAGLPGLWFMAGSDGVSCNELCSQQEGMEFDAASSQHVGNQASSHFTPGRGEWEYWGWDARGTKYIRPRCPSIESTAIWCCGDYYVPADGSTPDGDCRPSGRSICACKYSMTTDPQLLLKFDPVIASFNLGKCTAPRDGIIQNARDMASGGPCAEGAVFHITDGSATCTARCKDGFYPSVVSVPCTGGYPDALFQCIRIPATPSPWSWEVLLPGGLPQSSYTTFGNGPCRGTSPTDNPAHGGDGTVAEWYYLSSVTCLPETPTVCVAKCQVACDEDPACIAFEARQDGAAGRCEIWVREPLAYASNAKYTCRKKDTHTPHFPAATAGPSEARCAAEGGSPATQEGCEFACTHQQVAGATRYEVGSWSHSPGCFVVVDGQYKGGCHWNTNTGNIGYDYKARPVCTKPASQTLANCVDTDNGATGYTAGGMEPVTCQYYKERPNYCQGGYYYMDEDFTAQDMCCACGGGVM